MLPSRSTLAGVDLNLILALDALLTERNVTRAAARLSVGQPAMSASLRRLRSLFDDPLLAREGRTLSPTPLAETLEPLVRAAVGSLSAVFEKPQGFDPRRDPRSFRIMASDYVTSVLLRSVVLEFADATPLQRAVIVPVQQNYVEQLASGQIDLLIIPTELASVRPSNAFRQLFSDRFVLVAAADNDEVHENMTPAQFAELPYVSYSGGWLDSFADVQLRSLGFTPRTELSTQSFVIGPMLVEDSPLVSLVHERLARLAARRGGLKLVEPPIPLRPVTEMLFWHTRFTDDPAHAWWREQIARTSDRLAAE